MSVTSAPMFLTARKAMTWSIVLSVLMIVAGIWPLSYRQWRESQ